MLHNDEAFLVALYTAEEVAASSRELAADKGDSVQVYHNLVSSAAWGTGVQMSCDLLSHACHVICHMHVM